jgi:hypothetical protein
VSVAEPERKCFLVFEILFLETQGPPCRWGVRVRIAGRQQQLRLMRSQRPCRFPAGWPPFETSFGLRIQVAAYPYSAYRTLHTGGQVLASRFLAPSGKLSWLVRRNAHRAAHPAYVSFNARIDFPAAFANKQVLLNGGDLWLIETLQEVFLNFVFI